MNKRKNTICIVLGVIMLIGEFIVFHMISEITKIGLSNTWLAELGMAFVFATIFGIFWNVGSILMNKNRVVGKVIHVLISIMTGIWFFILLIFFVILCVNDGQIPQN